MTRLLYIINQAALKPYNESIGWWLNAWGSMSIAFLYWKKCAHARKQNFESYGNRKGKSVAYFVSKKFKISLCSFSSSTLVFFFLVVIYVKIWRITLLLKSDSKNGLLQAGTGRRSCDVETVVCLIIAVFSVALTPPFFSSFFFLV